MAIDKSDHDGDKILPFIKPSVIMSLSEKLEPGLRVRPPVRGQFRFIRSDAGRSQSRHARNRRDCEVRIVGLVTDVTYDEAYKILAAAGRKATEYFDFASWAAGASVNGYSFTWQSFPAVKGKPRMSLQSFCHVHPKGRFILRVARYYSAFIEGAIYDTAIIPPDKCVYGCWRVTRK